MIPSEFPPFEPQKINHEERVERNTILSPTKSNKKSKDTKDVSDSREFQSIESPVGWSDKCSAAVVK
jgi:hypothetical protein